MSDTGFFPKVVAPSKFRVQTESGGFQKPFFFGGAQTPINLGLSPNSFSGSGMYGGRIRGGKVRSERVFHKGTPSINKPVRLPFS